MRNLSIFILVIASVFSSSSYAHASAQESGMVHAVQPAETLLDLQLFYGVSADQLVEANSLTGMVGAGDDLAIPVTLASKELPTDIAPISYIVQRGDTLF